MKEQVKRDAKKIIDEIDKIIIGLEECSSQLIKISGVGEWESADALDNVIKEYRKLKEKLNNI